MYDDAGSLHVDLFLATVRMLKAWGLTKLSSFFDNLVGKTGLSLLPIVFLLFIGLTISWISF